MHFITHISFHLSCGKLIDRSFSHPGGFKRSTGTPGTWDEKSFFKPYMIDRNYATMPHISHFIDSDRWYLVYHTFLLCWYQHFHPSASGQEDVAREVSLLAQESRVAKYAGFVRFVLDRICVCFFGYKKSSKYSMDWLLIYRKPCFLPWNIGLSCRFSLKPIQWNTCLNAYMCKMHGWRDSSHV